MVVLLSGGVVRGRGAGAEGALDCGRGATCRHARGEAAALPCASLLAPQRGTVILIGSMGTGLARERARPGGRGQRRVVSRWRAKLQLRPAAQSFRATSLGRTPKCSARTPATRLLAFCLAQAGGRPVACRSSAGLVREKTAEWFPRAEPLRASGEERPEVMGAASAAGGPNPSADGFSLGRAPLGPPGFYILATKAQMEPWLKTQRGSESAMGRKSPKCTARSGGATGSTGTPACAYCKCRTSRGRAPFQAVRPG